MSAESIKAIGDKFAAQVVQACTEGRGEDHLHAFLAEIGADLAKTVFLKMDAEVAKARDHGPEEVADLWAWVQDFPYRSGLELIEGVTVSCKAYNCSPEQTDRAQKAVAAAYQQQLDKLFEASTAGGNA